ncbi:MAG: ATP synthase F1 subunit gamma [Bryobacteraceae bacterium]
MPSLIDIRRRIRSVRNTQQITKAMKMVSAAKLRRAQAQAVESRPYARMLEHILPHIVGIAAQTESPDFAPLLAVREEERIQLVVVSSDRGLAGAFNSNLFRMAQRFIDEHSSAAIRVEAIGKKARDYFRRRNFTLTGEHIGIVEKPSYGKAAEIARKLVETFRKAEVDAVYVAGNEFKNVMAPNLVLRKLLPVKLPEGGEPVAFIEEQDPERMLHLLLPRYVEMEIYRAMLESNSAEHAARMTAMDTATSNANDVIDSLTLNLNRARQANITREIIEIVGGAAALG